MKTQSLFANWINQTGSRMLRKWMVLPSRKGYDRGAPCDCSISLNRSRRPDDANAETNRGSGRLVAKIATKNQPQGTAPTGKITPCG